jgi:hypothetical protein
MPDKAMEGLKGRVFLGTMAMLGRLRFAYANC